MDYISIGYQIFELNSIDFYSFPQNYWKKFLFAEGSF